jgi:NAD(P)-dependent dehydrogenase (short-subunit alcohol dehydrogenase family)
VPEWLERGSGHFVVVASAAGLLTQLGAAPYSVTKHAAVGFAEWLAITFGDQGIGVSCACPMGVDTPLLRAMSDSPDAQTQVAGAAVTGVRAPCAAALQPFCTSTSAVRRGTGSCRSA